MSRGVKAVAFLILGASLGCRSQSKSVWPEPGMDLYSVALNSVEEVLISSSGHKLYAFRWQTDRPFQLVIASRENESAEQCAGGAGLERLLQALATVPVIKESEKHFRETTAAWADVR